MNDRPSADERELLAAVIARPDDDLPRLVYADYIEERGDPDRAEFIRLQCGLADGSLTGKAADRATARVAELQEQHQADWARPLWSSPTGHEYYRGFVGVVDATPAWLANCASELFTRTPVHGIRFVRADDDYDHPDPSLLRRLAAVSGLAHLKWLDLTGTTLGPENVRLLLGSPHLARLELIAFGDGDDTADTATAIVSSPTLAGLSELHIGGDPTESEFGDEGLRILAGAANLAGLRTLYLNNNGLGPAGAEALAASPHIRNLRQLHFGHGSYDPDQIGPDGLAALAASPNVRHLTDLSLPFNYVGDEGLMAMARSPYLTNVESLFLMVNNIGRKGLNALAGSANLAACQALGLNGNHVGDAGVEALAASPHAARLASLRLADTAVTSAGVWAIAVSPHLAGLKHLDLSRNPIDAAGLRALVESPYLTALESLYLHEVQFPPKMVRPFHDRFGDRVKLSGLGLAARIAELR